MIPGYRDFEFDLPGALLLRLVEILDGMVAAPLSQANLGHVPEAQGVYQLFLDDQLVYIGKTDAEAGLHRRLRRHEQKIQHRQRLGPARVSFKAVRIYVFTAVDLETQLIAHYGGFRMVRWNGSGFGSNNPGRERDTTNFKADHFDAIYPIDIDRALAVPLLFVGTPAAILTSLKQAVPYIFRFETAAPRSRQPHADLTVTPIELPVATLPTARTIISAVVAQLPPGWQAVQLPRHLILYKEARAYSHGTVVARS